MVQCNSEDLRTESQFQSWGKTGMKRQMAQRVRMREQVLCPSAVHSDQVFSIYLKLKVYVKCLPRCPAVEERCKKIEKKKPFCLIIFLCLEIFLIWYLVTSIKTSYVITLAIMGLLLGQGSGVNYIIFALSWAQKNIKEPARFITEYKIF